jgi:hypothetical protein
MTDDDSIDQDKTKIIQPKTPSKTVSESVLDAKTKVATIRPENFEQPPAPPPWEASQPSIPEQSKETFLDPDENEPSLNKRRRYVPIMITVSGLIVVGLLGLRMLVPEPAQNIEASMNNVVHPLPPQPAAVVVAERAPQSVPPLEPVGHHVTKMQFLSNLSSAIERTKASVKKQ